MNYIFFIKVIIFIQVTVFSLACYRTKLRYEVQCNGLQDDTKGDYKRVLLTVVS